MYKKIELLSYDLKYPYVFLKISWIEYFFWSNNYCNEKYMKKFYSIFILQFRMIGI